ncbi:hypothetical protein Tsubulata_047820 [Turnera subulata]|uniref:Uncharacterized protein n=1 Tax=Turnera subulata TaxID=218843 RepID=A0A9Q0JKY9_9ROSI|nr:hypothetical protein Tsubulata_047820 [Turnera subulata]
MGDHHHHQQQQQQNEVMKQHMLENSGDNNTGVASESRFTAEDIANSVQQIFSYIHANSSM